MESDKMYNNYNPYFYQPQPMQRNTPIDQTTQPLVTPQYQTPVNVTKPMGLLGKYVESIDVARVMEIPLDGSVSVFPLTDASAIITKQLLSDGTTKLTVYKPMTDEKDTTPTYLTIEEFNRRFSEINVDKIEEIEELVDEFKELKKELKDIKTKLKNKGE